MDGVSIVYKKTTTDLSPPTCIRLHANWSLLINLYGAKLVPTVFATDRMNSLLIFIPT